MLQPFEASNFLTDGNPAGGFGEWRGLRIDWQDCWLGRGADRIEPNGAFVETVIAAAKQRIEHYQTASDGRFNCEENARAILHLQAALDVLNERTAERERR